VKSLARILVFSFALFACTPDVVDSSPAKVLESYIQISFNIQTVADKKRMEDLLTGDTKNRLVSWSDEQFMKAFMDAKKKFLGLKTLESKKVNDHEVALTYELSYTEGPDDKTAQITQRKLATVEQEDGGGWKIKEVRSIRESIEYLKELSLP
jgi:ketosteroid isomerase-like protein